METIGYSNAWRPFVTAMRGDHWLQQCVETIGYSNAWSTDRKKAKDLMMMLGVNETIGSDGYGKQCLFVLSCAEEGILSWRVKGKRESKKK